MAEVGDTARDALQRDLGLLGAVAAPAAKVRGIHNGRALLTAGDVLAIRARVAAGETQRSLLGEYGISSSTMSCIIRRTTWKWLK